MKTDVQAEVSLIGQLINSRLRVVTSDLMLLARQNELQEMLQSSDAGWREALAAEYLSLLTRKGIYGQIRFLDETGMEVVRVNFNDGSPAIVPNGRLQSKAERYYFANTFLLERDEVFVSPFDLNIEGGEIERPLKPMIRLGTPVFDLGGRKRGIVLVNYLAADMLGALESADSHPDHAGRCVLVNSDGFYLKGHAPEEEWGFMLRERGDKTFGNDFPEAWQEIVEAESGQFRGGGGLFTHSTVRPLFEGQKSSTGSDVPFGPSSRQVSANTYSWKLISHVPADILDAGVAATRNRLLILYAVTLVVLSIGFRAASATSAKRKLTEEALRESEARYRDLWERAPIAYFSADTTGRIERANKQALELFGYAENQLIGRQVFELYADTAGGKERALEVFARFAAGNDVRSAELEYRRADGRHVWGSLAVHPVLDADGNVTASRSIVVDITDRKKAEAALARQAQELARSNQELEQFAYAASHDLQEPLRKIQGFGELLRGKYSGVLDDQGSDYLSRMHEAAARMQALIIDLLAISRVNSQPRPFVPVDLAELTTAVVTDLEVQVLRSGGRVEVGDMPTIEADPVQMRRLLQNLIGNGLKFHRPEEPPLVRVSGRLANGHESRSDGNALADEICEISVEDNGIGFDEKYLDQIFAVFQRLHGRAAFDGTGIGLALCRRIVERHAGTITATSAPGQGATFVVRLPAAQHRKESDNGRNG